MKFLPLKSLLIRHLAPKQKHQHSSSDYRSNRQDFATHLRRVNRQIRRHLLINCNVREARKCALMNFRKVSLDTMHLRVV